ncbi:hypothetical protein [Mammaliicoccus sciuri]|uniref:hypothetical protein n=1 Tax=Mammaliicoccus sciuri TaxID=1296 RepID=UPI002B263B5C|nr:hypothetical protein [Mammaliicoccus sciuri]WQL92596.1 hypothetical protein P3U75_14150 [Mammaliicoccus sciuri]
MAYSVTDRALLTKYNKAYQRVYVQHKQAEIEELYHLNCSTMGLDDAMGLSTKVFNTCDLSIHIIERKERLQRKIEVFKQANEDLEKALDILDEIRVFEAIWDFQKYGVRTHRNHQYSLKKLKKKLAEIQDEREKDEPIEDEEVNELSNEIQGYLEYEFDIEREVIDWNEVYEHLKGKHQAEHHDFKRRKEVM